MTKERISSKMKIAELLWDFNPKGKSSKVTNILNVLDDVANQELTAEREKAAKLVEALEMVLSWLDTGAADTVIPINLYPKVKQSLTEYKKQKEGK